MCSATQTTILKNWAMHVIILKGEGQLKCFQILDSSSKYIIYQIFSVQKVPVVSKFVFETTPNPLRLSISWLFQGNIKSKTYKYFFRLCFQKQNSNIKKFDTKLIWLIKQYSFVMFLSKRSFAALASLKPPCPSVSYLS